MATRTAKALAPAPTPRRISATEYAIDSFTNTLDGYRMTLGEHGWACTCQGFHYNRRCKHVARLHVHLSAGQHKSVTAAKGLTLEDLFRDVA